MGLVVSHFSHVQLSVTPWTMAHQAPLSMGFSRQEYWSGLPFPSPVIKYEVSEVAQSCPTLCDLMDCSLPGSSVHGIFQARVLEWVAISFFKRSSQPRDRTWTPALQVDSLLVEDSETLGKQYILGFKIAQLEYHHLHLLCS